MDKFCHSCCAPLCMPELKGPAENYCKNCTDEKGNVHPRDYVTQGLAQWFLTWQPDIDQQTAVKRADIYLRAMPHWAE
jgi:hypothetical protein